MLNNTAMAAEERGGERGGGQCLRAIRESEETGESA